MSSCVLHARGSRPSASMLAEALGWECGSRGPSERPEYMIRWGSHARTRFRPSGAVFNQRGRLEECSNKYTAMRIMHRRGAPVPPVSHDYRDIGFPCLGRETSHRGGTDVKVYMQSYDISVHGASEFYIKYIPKVKEYRLHVAFGRIIKGSVKDCRDIDNYDPIVWNHGSGHHFVDIPVRDARLHIATGAVESLGLHFGAVDMIEGEDGAFYVLEVNTAPGLIETTCDAYAEAFRNEISRRTQ